MVEPFSFTVKLDIKELNSSYQNGYIISLVTAQVGTNKSRK